MLLQKPPNYYRILIAKGARVVSPFTMTETMRKEGSRGPVVHWEVTAKLLLPDLTIYLKGSFYGTGKESQEAGEAHLNIETVMYHAALPVKELTRRNFVLLVLSDGLYACVDHNSSIEKKARSICDFNHNRYIGIASDSELESLKALGYKKIIEW